MGTSAWPSGRLCRVDWSHTKTAGPYTPLPDRDRARFSFQLVLEAALHASPEKLLLLRGRVVVTACTAKQVRRARRALLATAAAGTGRAASSSRSSAAGRRPGLGGARRRRGHESKRSRPGVQRRALLTWANPQTREAP